jgi:hypothetical protein
MTIDERLEALTQSLELLASLHKDNERRNEEMRQALRHDLGELAQSMRVMMQSMGAMADSIGRLGDIAHAHNGQLDSHETRIDRLENQ